jgi:hypothetical protein
MTQDDLIKNLAWLREEAGLEPAYPINHPMAKFISAIAARAKVQEREACAKVCGRLADEALVVGDEDAVMCFEEAEDAIRARGEA